MRIYVDADACPVKDEVQRVADRHDLLVVYVANSHMRLPVGKQVERMVVSDGADAADDWIVSQLQRCDIVITADIPLAHRSLQIDAIAINPAGKVFDSNAIGMALAMRNLMADLREANRMQSRNPTFTARDRSQFLQALENMIQKMKRTS